MRKVIDYVLEYREGGEAGSVSLSIDFVSNYIIREYNKITQITYEAQRAWDDIVYKMAEKKSLLVNGAKETDQEIIDANQFILDRSKAISQIGEDGILLRRFELVKMILIDNQINEPRLQTYEFWDRCVDPNSMLEFLELVVFKDIDKKKLN